MLWYQTGCFGAPPSEATAAYLLVLDSHERDLAELAGLGADRGQDDDRPPLEGGAAGSARRLVLLDLLGAPFDGTRFVFSVQWHTDQSTQSL